MVPTLPNILYHLLRTQPCKTILNQLSVSVEKTEQSVYHFLFILLCVCALLLFLRLCLFCFDVMFTLFGLVNTPWPPLTDAAKKRQAVKLQCDNCSTTKSPSYCRMTYCKHLYCQQCLSQYCEVLFCNCPACPKLQHTLCYICHGQKKM